MLGDHDVYVSTVGGVRFTEPGGRPRDRDRVARRVRDARCRTTLAAVGEISLAGEVRPVTAARQRAAEADGSATRP